MFAQRPWARSLTNSTRQVLDNFMHILKKNNLTPALVRRPLAQTSRLTVHCWTNSSLPTCLCATGMITFCRQNRTQMTNTAIAFTTDISTVTLTATIYVITVASLRRSVLTRMHTKNCRIPHPQPTVTRTAQPLTISPITTALGSNTLEYVLRDANINIQARALGSK